MRVALKTRNISVVVQQHVLQVRINSLDNVMIQAISERSGLQEELEEDQLTNGGRELQADHIPGASSILQMQGVNLALMESKQAERKAEQAG